jgi:hypothetical protein
MFVLLFYFYKYLGPKWIPFVGNTYQLAKLSSIKNGQYLAFEELRQRYNSDIIGLKLGREYVVIVFGNDLLSETLHRDEFQGRPDNFFMRLRTMGKRRGKYLISYHIKCQTYRIFFLLY